MQDWGAIGIIGLRETPREQAEVDKEQHEDDCNQLNQIVSPR